MSDLAEELRAYAEQADPVTAADATARGRARRRRHRRRNVAGAGAALALAATVLVAVSIGDRPGRDEPDVRTTAPPSSPVTATVTGHDLGPLRVSLTPLVPVGDAADGAWLRQELVIANDGDEPLDMINPPDLMPTPSPGPRPALVAHTEGCSYAEARDDVGSLCDLVGRTYPLPAGESIEIPVRLWRDRPLMAPLAPGRYTFVLRFVVGGDAGVGTIATVEITYMVSEAALDG